MYKLELLIIAFIFIVAGAIMLFVDVDVGAKGISLAEVLIIIGIIFIIIWAILFAVVNVIHR